MRKPYVYLYTSSAALLVLGFLLVAMDLVMKSQGVPSGTALLTLVDPKSPAFQAGAVMWVIGVYHFVLGVKVDASCKQLDSVGANFLDETLV